MKGQALLLELIGDGEQRLELLFLLAPVLVQLQEDLSGTRCVCVCASEEAPVYEKQDGSPTTAATAWGA